MRSKLLFPLTLMLLGACNAPSQEAVPEPMEPVSNESAARDTVRPTSLSTDRTIQAYTSGIAEYIKAVTKNDGSGPDTLYLGRHADFPDIELPAIIEHTHIRLLAPNEAHAVKDDKDFVYLNVMGWLDADTAEFMIVTFNQGIRPKHNCVMYLIYNTERRDYHLDSMRFEYPYPKTDG